MSTVVSKTPKSVSLRALQRIEALRQAISPVCQAAPENGTDKSGLVQSSEYLSEEQYEFALFPPDIADTPSEQQHHPVTLWNRGRIVGAKLPLRPKHMWTLRFHLYHEHQVRDLALFNLAIDSKLRGCDLILHGQPNCVQRSFSKRHANQSHLNPSSKPAIACSPGLKWRGGNLEDFVFPSRTNPAAHISTRQYARLVDELMVAIDLNPAFYGTHSMRRTKIALIYKKTGNQILLGHTKLKSTVRYLGVDIYDALTLSEAADL
jgi:hypothetical protein